MRSHQLVAHTADIRLKVAANTLPELFIAALEGMDEIIKPGFCQDKKDYRKSNEIKITAKDATILLIDFLSEVLSLTQQIRVLFCKVEFLEFTENSLRAKIFGRAVSGFDEDIKAVTYHQAEVKRNKRGNWQTVIIFDI